jgi:hypothetical protein
MTEVIILFALVCVTLMWMVRVFPEAIKTHYIENRNVLASPF